MGYVTPHRSRCALCNAVVIWQRDANGAMRPFTASSRLLHAKDCTGRREKAATRGRHQQREPEPVQTSYLPDQE